MTDPQEKPDEAVVKCEICGKQGLYEISSHIRENHGMSVQEYMDAHQGAPVVHQDVLTFLESATIHLDVEGHPWRLVSKWDKLGFSAYGPVVPHKSAPRIDPHFEFPAEATKLLYYAFEAGQRPLLVGPPSTGKSCLALNMCAALGWGFQRVNFNGQATPRSLFGSPRAGAQGETYFLYGVVPLAMRGNDGKGECLLLDEIGFIDPDMSAGLHPVMEPGGSLVLQENGGEVVWPGPLFRIIGTDNVGAQGDMTGAFHGVKPLNAAFMDRWSMQINVGYMDQGTETDVLLRKVPELPRKVADIMCEISNASREQSGDTEILNPVTFRQVLDWASLAVQHRDILAGWKAVVLNKASEEDAIVLGTLFKHKFPELADD
jgi:cobaltochelatase CobS